MKSASANSDRLFAGCRGCNQVEKVGGRELVMLTKVNGDSCIYISAQQGHLDVVKALLEAGGHGLLMLTTDDSQLAPHQCGGGASGC